MPDAGMTVSPAGEESTPAVQTALGWLGAGLDQVVLRRVATATMRALVDSFAGAITGPATTGQAAHGPSLGWRLDPETGTP